MDFIVANEKKIEQGYLKDYKSIDIDLGDTNDFEITLDLDIWDKTQYTYGYLFYRLNTEYGGIIEDMRVDTKTNSIRLLGYTWRGLLTQKIIRPPDGQDYFTVAGEANNVLRQVIGNAFNDLFVVDDIDSGFTVNYQFDRYTNMLKGFEKMLKTVNAKLKLYFDNADMQLHIQATPITDYSQDLEYSQDNKINFTTRDYRAGINHLICLGQGELSSRQIVDLYLQMDGAITETIFYKDLDERVAIYDYSSAEDLAELKRGGIERLEELMDFKEMQMSVEKIEAEIGDIVGGKERITGLSMKKPVIQKILNISDSKEKIQFKVGD